MVGSFERKKHAISSMCCDKLSYYNATICHFFVDSTIGYSDIHIYIVVFIHIIVIMKIYVICCGTLLVHTSPDTLRLLVAERHQAALRLAVRKHRHAMAKYMSTDVRTG